VKKVSIADVAKVAGVSKSTVSQYLNKRFHFMGEDTKYKITQAIEDLNYKPNYIARSLKQKKTSTIGVIVANISHSFSTQIIQAIESYCQLNQFHVIVSNADDSPEKEKNHIEMLLAKQVDGLIVFPTGENQQVYQNLLDENFPLIFIDRLGPNGKGTSILLDNEKAIHLAVKHLTEENVYNLGIVTTTLKQQLTPRLERVDAFHKVMQKKGIRFNENFIISTEIKNMKNDIKKMLLVDNPPNGIIAGNDLSLLQVLELFREENVKIPEDISVIGIDEVSFAKAFHPTITTIAQPIFDMGTEAAKILIKKINKEIKEDDKIYRFEPEIIVRESSKRLLRK